MLLNILRNFYRLRESLLRFTLWATLKTVGEEYTGLASWDIT